MAARTTSGASAGGGGSSGAGTKRRATVGAEAENTTVAAGGASPAAAAAAAAPAAAASATTAAAPAAASGAAAKRTKSAGSEEATRTLRQRIIRELRELVRDKPAEIGAAPVDDNIFVWNAHIEGPKGTPYEGGLFELEFVFPEGASCGGVVGSVVRVGHRISFYVNRLFT